MIPWGDSVLKQANDAEDKHPIHEFHNELRKQGYRPESSHRLGGKRTNFYVNGAGNEAEITYTPGKGITHHETFSGPSYSLPGETSHELRRNLRKAENHAYVYGTDAADAKKGVTWEQYAERKEYQATPGSSKRVPKDDVLQHRFYADLDGSGKPVNLGKGTKSPKMAQHVSNFYKANPAHEKVTAVGAEDAMSEEQKKHKLGEDEQISEVHNLPEKVKRPLVASSPE